MLKPAGPYAPPTPLFADQLIERMLSLAQSSLCYSPISHALCPLLPHLPVFLPRSPPLLCLLLCC
jgi:hypothetical protein